MSFTEIDPSFRIPDTLWEQIKKAIPPQPAKPKGGRPRMDDRQALDAIFYVLRTGCQWNALPRSLGASSTVHDRYQDALEGRHVHLPRSLVAWLWSAVQWGAIAPG